MEIPFILGAYASHPAPELEADYYQLLADQPWVSGVEIPYPGQLATQADVLAAHLAPHWDFNTITAIPGTMQHVWKDATFGLASPDEEGRQATLAFTRALCDDLDNLCDKAGRLLVGRVFSGAGPEETQYGYAWIDGHLPAQADEPTSLMDAEQIGRCAQAALAGGAEYLGAKVCVPKDASLAKRLAMLEGIYRACHLQG